MNWAEWEPHYLRILDEFGFDRGADERARDALGKILEQRAALLPTALNDFEDLRRRVEGRRVVVLGPASPPPLLPGGPWIVAEAAAPFAADLAPTRVAAITTDLDGDVPLLLRLHAEGAALVVHAHGDNREALATWGPELSRAAGPVLGTTQAQPRGLVHNFGGFTDGDRACFVAASLGAASILVAGFDFETPIAKPGADPAVKRKKLAWARKLIPLAGVPVAHLSSRG